MPVQTDLFGLEQELTPAEQTALRKRDLRNLLTSYADEADVFAEVIQNAVDAVITAHNRGLYGSGSSPTIDIVMGMPSDDPHYLHIYDNGIGMAPDVAQKFTTPGYSANKRLGVTVGYKGVGASFFFAAANRIAFVTCTSLDDVSMGTVTGAFNWIMHETEPRPSTDGAAQFPDYVRESDLVPHQRGTAVCYYFHEGWKPKNLSRIVKREDDPDRELKNWATFLCAKTALGQVDDISRYGIRVRLHLVRDGVSRASEWTFGPFSRENKTLGYPYPWRVYAVSEDLSRIESTPAHRQAEHRNMHAAIHLRWNKDKVVDLDIDLSDDELELVIDHLEFMDVYFAYSVDVLKEVHARSGCISNQIRYGMRIACDGIPQGRPIDFDLTSNQGLSRQAHAVIAFKGLELDTGRKIPSNEVINEVVRKLGVRAMGTLAGCRWAMRKSERLPPTSELADWRARIAAAEPDSIVVRLFAKLGTLAPIQVDPDSENDVIALFGGLVAAGVLRGYKLCALSGMARYDGLAHVDADSNLLRDPDDSLSIRETPPEFAAQPTVIEFKHLLSALVDNFEDRTKNPREVDILVCWSLPTMQVNRGRVAYCYGDRKNHRQLYAATHVWKDDNDTDTVHILSLKHVVAEKLKQLEGDSPGIGAARFAELQQSDREHSI